MAARLADLPVPAEDPATAALIISLAGVRRRGVFNRAELLLMATWKSPRARPHYLRNSPALVRSASRAALAARSEHERMAELMRLTGVSISVASAILHSDRSTSLRCARHPCVAVLARARPNDRESSRARLHRGALGALPRETPRRGAAPRRQRARHGVGALSRPPGAPAGPALRPTVSRPLAPEAAVAAGQLALLTVPRPASAPRPRPLSCPASRQAQWCCAHPAGAPP